MMVEEKTVGFAAEKPRKSFGIRKNKNREQMRLVALQDGELRHVNDSFSDTLGLATEDIVGKNLLDFITFRNPNTLKDAKDKTLTGLKAGAHILQVGDNQRPYNFYFDWVHGHDDKKYLIASSIIEDKPDEWTHFIEEMRTPAEMAAHVKKTSAPGFKARTKTGAETPFLQAVNDSGPVSGTDLDSMDMAIFTALNNDFMCVIETDGTIKRFNNHFEDHIKSQFRDNILNAVSPEDKASVRQLLLSLQENTIDETGMEFETRMKSGQKQQLWIRWTIHKQDEEFYCLGQNITAAKLNEASLKRHEKELSEAQALAQMGHWRWVVGAETLEWSDQIYKIFGVTRDNFVPTLERSNALLHKRDIGHMIQAFQRAIIEQNDYDLDFRVAREDGTIAYVRCEGRCELDSDGDVVALYGVMQDITEQTEYAMELRKAKDSAEQAYASKSRFLANMSHELRTPLNAIIGFSDMLEREMLGPLGNEKYLEYASSIKNSGEHLLDLITDILDMSKIEAGKYELDLEKIELGDVVTTAMRMIESRANEGVITLDNKITEDGPVIYADRRAVMQIMLNILSNAVKFTEPGGTITTSIDEFENHVTIRVTDTGIGIPANKLSDVLLPFEQVSTALTRNHEGSGLGLSITKELAELHGGMISLESKEGEGTTASIRLPRDAGKKQKK